MHAYMDVGYIRTPVLCSRIKCVCWLEAKGCTGIVIYVPGVQFPYSTPSIIAALHSEGRRAGAFPAASAVYDGCPRPSGYCDLINYSIYLNSDNEKEAPPLFARKNSCYVSIRILEVCVETSISKH